MSRILKSHPVHDEHRWLPLPHPTVEPKPESGTEEDPRETLLRAAREEADALLLTARQESAMLQRQAHDEGFAQGLTAGEAAYQAKLGYLDALVQEVNAEHRVYLEQAEGELVRLAIGIAEKILCRQLALEPQTIVGMARAHLQRIREREMITISIHPQDLPALERGRDTLLQSVEDLKAVALEGDSRLECGDLMFEAENGTLDARIATQMAVVKRAFAEAEDTVDEPPLI